MSKIFNKAEPIKESGKKGDYLKQ